MRTINFCIPFVGTGVQYAEFLVSNLYATARHPERISISMSVHGDADMAAIKNSQVLNVVGSVVTVPPYQKPGVFAGSVNHSRAINALAANSEADIALFSDYDMAFVGAGWDTKIEDILESHDFCGVAYPMIWFTTTLPELKWLQNAPLAKYQGKPNLSFFAITKKCLDATFERKLTDFDEFIAGGGIPFQLVNTHQMAAVYGLPLGSVLWLDTGFELPRIIESRKLAYRTFLPVDFDKQKIFPRRSDFVASGGGISEGFSLPEIFTGPDGTIPFLVHFKKGTAKSQQTAGFGFDKFRKCVESYLQEAATIRDKTG